MVNITNCIVFEENNEWEGETWFHMIPYKNNEDAYLYLKDKIQKSDNYDIHLINDLDLDTVNKIPSPHGYMSTYHVLNGIINLQSLKNDLEKYSYDEEAFEPENDPLYKGSIASYVKIVDEDIILCADDTAYETKYVVINAVEWTGTEESLEEIYSKLPGSKEALIKTIEDNNIMLYVDTLEGKLFASVGDFIVKGLIGEFYACKPIAFHMKYKRKN